MENRRDWYRRREKLNEVKNVEDVENEGKEKVDLTGLKKETREAEGMGLLQWQREWGGSPDSEAYGGTIRMNDVLRAALGTKLR